MRRRLDIFIWIRGILTPWPIVVLLCLLPSYLWAKDPAAMYMMECQGCHLADGGGGINSIPTLHNNVAKFPAVPGGREYLVQVPGVALSSLSDQDITAVLNWMLTKFGPIEWTGQYAPYTVEEVAILRKKPLTEVSRKRADLILLIHELESTDAPG
jgi:hypothetical protein